MKRTRLRTTGRQSSLVALPSLTGPHGPERRILHAIRVSGARPCDRRFLRLRCSRARRATLFQPEGVVNLYASVIGMTDGHTAYQVWIKYGDAYGYVPDAWSFHDNGCPTSDLLQMTPGSNSLACPRFQGASPSFQILRVSDLWPPEFGYPTTLMRAGLGNIYPDGVRDPDPLQRYQLVRFSFDRPADRRITPSIAATSRHRSASSSSAPSGSTPTRRSTLSAADRTGRRS